LGHKTVGLRNTVRRMLPIDGGHRLGPGVVAVEVILEAVGEHEEAGDEGEGHQAVGRGDVPHTPLAHRLRLHGTVTGI